MVLSLNFMLVFIALAMLLLFSLMIFSSITDEVEQVTTKCYENCKVSFADPLRQVEQDESNLGLIIIPILIVPILFIISSVTNDGDPFALTRKMFSGFGGSTRIVKSKSDFSDKGWIGADEF